MNHAHHLVAGTILALGALAAAPAQQVLTVARDDGLLRTVDPISGTTLSTMLIALPGIPSIRGANGLAYDSVQGRLWAILRISNTVRALGWLDPTNGSAALVGNLTDNFAGLSYSPQTDTLYAVTGDGALNPEQLFTLDRATGAATLVMPLGNGTDGESIHIHPGTGTMYHASGFGGIRNVDRIFETIDVTTGTTGPIPMSGFDADEIHAMTHWVGDTLLIADGNLDLALLQGNGAMTRLSTLDHAAKGIVFVPPVANVAHFQSYGHGCPDGNGYVPLLAGVGVPRPGNQIDLVVGNAPGGAPTILVLGIGPNPVPLLPGCDLQVAPLTPMTLNIVIGGSGPGLGTGRISLPLASTLPRLNAFFQGAFLSGGQLLLSNPLRVHVE